MPLHIIRQDITKMKVDAIVNTTNEELVGYSGVDLAIHSVAGSELDKECRSIAPLSLGQAKITGGYALPAKYVIHTQGPVWRGGGNGESELLRSCYLESLKLAVKWGCESIAFPLISSGVYCFPKDMVLRFAVSVITEFLFEHELDVYVCVFDNESYAFSQKLFDDIKDFIGEGSQTREKKNNEETFCRTESYKPDFARLSKDGVLPTRSQQKASVYEGDFDEDDYYCGMRSKSLDEYLKEKDKSFAERLFDLIDERGMSDVECYKRANVDKRTFSKIKSNKDYRPSKQTAIAFCISLRLDIKKTEELLGAAGFALSQSRAFDKIIRYFILNGIYDVFEINQALFEFDQPLLGSL